MTIINLIVGLGNPGKEYESTRHNVGFWALDELAASYSLNWTFEKTFFAHIAKIKQDAITTYLLKPQTFMNRSGLAVGTFAKYHKIPSDSIYVIHDELDLLPGQLKRKQGGSNAGHNGLKDIQKALGTPDFWRFRLGIGHPRTLNLSQNVADFVLHPPKNTDKELILESIALSLVDCHALIAGKPPSSNRSTP